MIQAICITEIQKVVTRPIYVKWTESDSDVFTGTNGPDPHTESCFLSMPASPWLVSPIRRIARPQTFIVAIFTMRFPLLVKSHPLYAVSYMFCCLRWHADSPMDFLPWVFHWHLRFFDLCSARPELIPSHGWNTRYSMNIYILWTRLDGCNCVLEMSSYHSRWYFVFMA